MRLRSAGGSPAGGGRYRGSAHRVIGGRAAESHILKLEREGHEAELKREVEQGRISYG